MNKIKLLMICHFSDDKIRSHLLLKKNHKIADYAVWITNQIDGYEKRNDVELYIVSPHKGMQKRRQEYEINSIHYYFFRSDPFIGQFVEKVINYLCYYISKGFINRILEEIRGIYRLIYYYPQKIYVKALVKRIKPDIIHLNGAENPYYSSTILGLKKCGIPICVIIQGIVSDPQVIKYEKGDISRIKIEKKIHSSFHYYIVGSTQHYALVKQDNPKAIFLFSPEIRTINIDLEKECIEKKYDFVFFARITKTKGIEHLIEAVSKLKNDYSDISLLVLGPCSKSYQEYLLQLCNDKGVSNNVVFGGHIQKREDLFRKALEAKIYVLPTLIEGLATSAVEAMLLGLPVITYATGGMPFLNKDGENVLMAPTGDIDSLVLYMKKLLDDPIYAQEIAKRGQNFAKRVFSEESNIETRIRQYRAIIANYKEGVPIPDELIFDGTYK
jgi:glycosyltransferase involved in cell wall biosynthesis